MDIMATNNDKLMENFNKDVNAKYENVKTRRVERTSDRAIVAIQDEEAFKDKYWRLVVGKSVISRKQFKTLARAKAEVIIGSRELLRNVIFAIYERKGEII